MFGFLGRAKQAEKLATSIGQLIHMLATGLETMGPEAPERLLRKLASRSREELMHKTRTVTALVPMATKEEMIVNLMIEANAKQTLMFDGGEKYAGFSLSCGLPPQTVLVYLQPTARLGITKNARELHAACLTMPNAIDASNL